MPRSPFNYDPTTPAGMVRLLITDTQFDDYVFSDAEINVFLLLGPSSVFIAAALACEAWARSQGKLLASRREGDTASTRHSPESLLALATSLRNSALNGGLVTGEIDVSTPGELLDSYRPEWRGIDDLPVVE